MSCLSRLDSPGGVVLGAEDHAVGAFVDAVEALVSTDVPARKQGMHGEGKVCMVRAGYTR